VTADVYLNNTHPIELIARGSDLGTSTPTYYALQIIRGVNVQLVKVSGGTVTNLGSSLDSTSYYSAAWATFTLGMGKCLRGAACQCRAAKVRPDACRTLHGHRVLCCDNSDVSPALWLCPVRSLTTEGKDAKC
jgi:hypothetical protein